MILKESFPPGQSNPFTENKREELKSGEDGN